jgi:LysM repeat protein
MIDILTRRYRPCKARIVPPTSETDKNSKAGDNMAYVSSPGSRVAIVAAGLLALSACSTTPDQSKPVAAPAPESAQEPQVKVAAPPPAPKPTPAPATEAQFREVYPQKYVVQKGDTLWDISTKFLRDPWYWPEIWYNNTQVANPHLIYPGDVLTIIYVDGRPRVQVSERGPEAPRYTAGGAGVVKLTPQIRSEDLSKAIPTIPIEAIRQLLVQTLVVDKETLEDAPYIISSVDDRLINATGDSVYVSGLDDPGVGRYSVYRPQSPLRDTETGQILGYEAVYVGDGTLVQSGDPATMLLTKTVREALREDRVAPADVSGIDRDFFPRPPTTEIEGRVISLFDAISQIGTYQVAVINRGTQDGIEVGHLLALERAGEAIPDPRKGGSATVQLPDVRSGLMMVIRSFDEVSYGLVMEATRAIHIDDYARTP